MVSAPLAVLRQPDAAMVDVLQALTQLDRSDASFRTLRVGIAANVTLDLFATYLRRHAYLAGVRLEVLPGHYDDLLGDVQRFAAEKVDLLFILPFFDNLQASWESRLGLQEPEAADAPAADYLARLGLALASAQGAKQIVLAGAHTWHAAAQWEATSLPEAAVQQFNTALRSIAVAHAQVRFLDSASVLATVGARHALDARFYYRNKAPYTPAFLDALAARVSLMTRHFGTVFYKVLVLDCDNTLWGGILGEEGSAGIALDPHTYPGNVFWNVQQQVLALERCGVLLCLCSKNNAADVDLVLQDHPHMVIKPAHLVSNRVNWSDKASNLRALAAELNLGLDSFVFVDDSDFEVQAVREQLPMVRVFQVPKRLTDYPALMRELSALFLAGGMGLESANKTQQYRQIAEASSLQAAFASQEEYLQSLQLKVRLSRNVPDQVARIAELMNKSNQFNLTTLRMTAGEVAARMAEVHTTVYALSVSDRLGDHGLTGVLIAEAQGEALSVCAFLMSCRVIGRGVEFALWQAVAGDALKRGLKVLRATYAPTEKNQQVADFYDRLGLKRVSEGGDGSRHYESPLQGLQLANRNWVELIDD